MMIATLYIYSALAFAASNCGNVRLDQPGKSMARMDIYDQGESDLCYAFTAAQMIDAYRFSLPTGSPQIGNEQHLTSPLALAIHENNRQRMRNGQMSYRDNLDMGDPYTTINTARTTGSCNDASLRRLISVSRGSGQTLSYNQIQGLFEKRNIPGVQQNLQCALQRSGFSPEQLSTITTLQNLRSILASPLLFKDLIAPICKDQNLVSLNTLPEPRRLVVNERGTKRREEAVELFRKNFSGELSQPIGINYCADFLRHSNRNVNAFDNPTAGKGTPSPCQLPHASVVIGSRENGGKCEYLLRNTRGRTCQGYDRKWTANQNCDEKGQLWIPEDVLLKNIDEMSWIP